jgi:hypothetical protein
MDNNGAGDFYFCPMLHFVSQVPSQATARGSGAECADFGFTRCHSVSLGVTLPFRVRDSEGVSLLTSGQAATHNTYSEGTYLEQFFQDAS